MTTELKNYIISFQNKKKLSPKISFYSRALKHIFKKNKKLPSDLSSSVDQIVYGN